MARNQRAAINVRNDLAGYGDDAARREQPVKKALIRIAAPLALAGAITAGTAAVASSANAAPMVEVCISEGGITTCSNGIFVLIYPS